VFAAIEPPEPVRAELDRLRGRLRACGARVAWPSTENMHLTLRFYGELDESAAGAAEALLEAACKNAAPIPLSVRGAGAFPSTRRPSVLWAGVVCENDALETLQARAEDAARAAGLPRERRAFHPHITLGRVRDPRDAGRLSRALEAERDFDGGAFTAACLVLFASELCPEGAQYTVLRRFPLGPEGSGA
jgi:2'-5' RNA ligase